MTDVRQMVSVEDARRLVLDQVRGPDTETVELGDTLDRILARPVFCPNDIPPFDNSAMDGYAVRAVDVVDAPVDLRVSADIPAGAYPEARIDKGTCARIMTGAPLPRGTDSVVPVEWTSGFVDVGSTVTVRQPAQHGAHVRRAGEDVRSGEMVLEQGIRITPPVVGMLASVGASRVEVARRPRVAVVTTGDELVEASDKPGPGQIRNSNGPTISAQIESTGGIAVGPYHASDNPASIRSALEKALESDVVVVSGGVSVGSYDLVKEELEKLGLNLLFWRVKQRPGKPLAFGTFSDTLFFGLPGNPVSSSICFDQYVRPAIRKMMGAAQPLRNRWPASLGDGITTPTDLHVYARGVCSADSRGILEVVSTGPQGSHIFSSMVTANCIIHLPVGTGDFKTGDQVEIEWFRW